MGKLINRRSKKKSHLPPGTPVFVGESRATPVKIEVIDYDAGHVERREVGSIEACLPFKDSPTVTWLNVDGLEDVGLIDRLGRSFGLHPLVIEDIVNTGQRPKAEIYEKTVYAVVRMLTWNAGTRQIDSEQVSLVLGPGFVLSFQERAGDVFGPLRERIESGKGRVRQLGADYLFYSLIDSVVDGYFAVLENTEEAIDELEERLTHASDPALLTDVRDTRRGMIYLRKCVWPLREAISSLYRGESGLIGRDTLPYLRDVYDHTIQVMDTIESFRDVVGGMQDTYLSNLSNKMNEVMKTLTIIATIFIPLTFIAGVYGMNFRHPDSRWCMPELEWYWGYPAVLGVMALVVVGMLIYFRRRRWL